jgi:hypothetical protein
MKLVLLGAILIIASPNITFTSFGADVVRNIANFSHTVVLLLDRFQRGAYSARFCSTSGRGN